MLKRFASLITETSNITVSFDTFGGQLLRECKHIPESIRFSHILNWKGANYTIKKFRLYGHTNNPEKICFDFLKKQVVEKHRRAQQLRQITNESYELSPSIGSRLMISNENEMCKKMETVYKKDGQNFDGNERKRQLVIANKDIDMDNLPNEVWPEEPDSKKLKIQIDTISSDDESGVDEFYTARATIKGFDFLENDMVTNNIQHDNSEYTSDTLVKEGSNKYSNIDIKDISAKNAFVSTFVDENVEREENDTDDSSHNGAIQSEGSSDIIPVASRIRLLNEISSALSRNKVVGYKVRDGENWYVFKSLCNFLPFAK